MTDRFRKLTRWLQVVLSLLGLLWIGCRSVEPVYQDVPSSSDPREAYHQALGRAYYVGGEVRKPGPKAYLGKTTVTTAIQAAGDFTELANLKKISLTRQDQETNQPIRVTVVEALKDPKKDLPVFPGDRIDVPRKWWR